MSGVHSGTVRVTHWVAAVAILGLVVSGVAILLAHPRLYWGETGAVGTPSLVDLPLPFVLTGQTGWGRSLHFLSAWVCVVTGLVYWVHGAVSAHFRRDLLGEGPAGYSGLQRSAYFAVVFVLMPAMVWTGLAMSPMVTAAAPVLVEAAGGQQSARTIHFAVAVGLVVFVFGHVGMVAVSGFVERMRGMIVGSRGAAKEGV